MKHWRLTILTHNGGEVDSTMISANNREEALKISNNLLSWQGIKYKYTLRLIK
jgi:hypothetical protein